MKLNMMWNTNIPIQTELRVVRPELKCEINNYPESITPIDVTIIKQCCGGDKFSVIDGRMYTNLNNLPDCSSCGLCGELCKCHDPILCLNCKWPVRRCNCPDY